VKENLEILRELYDKEVKSTDFLMATLLNELARRDNTLVVISSDHGEEFFEHGGTEHGRTLYEEACEVPLIVVLPPKGGGAASAAREISAPVSLIDVAPSVLNYLELPAPPTMEGRDDIFRGSIPEGRDVYVTLNRGGDMLSALIRGDKKVIARIKGEDHEIKYFDLKSDPAEQRPLPLDDAGELLKEKLLTWVKERDVSREGAGRSLFRERADLRALGYM